MYMYMYISKWSSWHVAADVYMYVLYFHLYKEHILYVYHVTCWGSGRVWVEVDVGGVVWAEAEAHFLESPTVPFKFWKVPFIVTHLYWWRRLKFWKVSLIVT